MIDDSEEFRTTLLEVLVRAGIDPYVAERETVDIEAVAAWKPDVIVLDPRGGAGARRRPFSIALVLRRHPALAAIPLLLLTDSWTTWQHEAEVGIVQPAEVLPKPFSVDELLEAIGRLTPASRAAAQAHDRPGRTISLENEERV